MPVSLHNQVGFLNIVGRHPFRFILSACTLGLCILCGVSSSLLFHGQAAVRLPACADMQLCAAALLRATLCAAAWQTMLASAVCYGKEGGSRAAVALSAFGLEGLAYGFALSELLFSYGEKGMPALSLAAAICGMMGVVLRLYWFLQEDDARMDAAKRKERGTSKAALRFAGRLAVLTLLQGCVMPLLFHLLCTD